MSTHTPPRSPATPAATDAPHTHAAARDLPGCDGANMPIRPITAQDDATMAAIIRTVMPTFGACGDGFAINDPEVDWLSSAYAVPRAAYFVVEHEGRVQGGGGVAALEGADPEICELRKMYFLPALRGRGAGTRLMAACLDAARGFGYQRCYIETLHGMDAAIALYERSGFVRIPAPLGNTGHGGCDRYYLRAL